MCLFCAPVSVEAVHAVGVEAVHADRVLVAYGTVLEAVHAVSVEAVHTDRVLVAVGIVLEAVHLVKDKREDEEECRGRGLRECTV